MADIAAAVPQSPNGCGGSELFVCKYPKDFYKNTPLLQNKSSNAHLLQYACVLVSLLFGRRCKLLAAKLPPQGRTNTYTSRFVSELVLSQLHLH